MDEPTVCPVCHHKNLVGALICARCGTPLTNAEKISRTTRHVPTNTPKMQNPQSLTADLAPGTLVIMIDGESEPILFANFERILLGRAAISQNIPLLDLSLHDGFARGVSRHHATIIREDDDYFLKDEGSSNGSWINHIQLQPYKPQPLHSGDAVRLGQLSLRVYFRGSKTELTQLHLQRSLPDKPFTAQELVNSVGPFLVALSHAQSVMDKLLKRQTAEVTIDSIKVQISVIMIQLAGASEIIEFAKTKLAAPKLSDASKGSAELTNPDEVKNYAAAFDNLSLENKAQLTELARTFLIESSPVKDEAANLEPYVQDLLPAFYVLTTTDIKITNS